MPRLTRPLWGLMLISLCLGALLLGGCGEDAEVALDVTVEGEDRATISGSVVGVTGPITLSLNGGETVTINQSGSFAFSSGVFHGVPAQITVTGQPSFGNCVVKNGDHASVSGDIVVRVACIAAGFIQDPLNLDISSANVGTPAGSGASAFADAVGTAAAFSLPMGAATDGERIWMADSGNNRIRQVDIATGSVTTAVGDGTPGVLNAPNGVTTDGNILWIANSSANAVSRFDLATGVLTTVLTGLGAPSDVTTDGRYVYVLERLANQVRRYDPGTGAAPVIATGFNQPYSITHDGTWLYVADSGNNLVARVNPSTGASTAFVTGLTTPRGVATDGTWLYTANSGFHTIHKTDLATGATSLLAGIGGSSGATDGAAASAQFLNPFKPIPVGGKLFVSSGANNTLRVIQ